MTLEKRDWWWMIGMLIVGSSGFDTENGPNRARQCWAE